MSRRKKRSGADLPAAFAGVFAALGILALIGVSGLKPPGASGDAWLSGVKRDVAAQAGAWLDIELADGIAFVSGVAPAGADRAAGFAAARETLLRAPPAAQTIAVVVDATRADDADEITPGAAVRGLAAAPSPDDCAKTFAAIMAGRTVAFAPGDAALAPDQGALLDPIAAAAIRCRAHAIAVTGRGDGPAGQRLAERRAHAVLDYIVAHGGDAAALTASAAPAPRRRGRPGDDTRIDFDVSPRA